MGYRYADAYHLLRYQTPDRGEAVEVWNARDGAAPLVITLPSGRTATRVAWYAERLLPDHEPDPGDWVFAGPPDRPLLVRWAEAQAMVSPKARS